MTARERLISRVADPSGVSLTGLTDTGASCDAPARSTIGVYLSVRHKNTCVTDEGVQKANSGT